MSEQVLNPRTPVANGSPVTAANPLPVTIILVAPPADTGVVLNPITWVVDGVVVSTSNPIPLQVV